MDYSKLAEEIYFAKDAADYLGISTQRLNMLVKEEKISPFKKSPSGTLFHISELKKRQEELSIFDEYKRNHDETGRFEIDTSIKQESLNFATLLNALNVTEKKLNPLVDAFSERYDITEPITNLVEEYSHFFNLNAEKLISEYRQAKDAFSKLKYNDEILKRGSKDYPILLSEVEQAPRFLYVRGKKALLDEIRTVSLVGSRNASPRAKESTYKLAKKLGANGITVISGLAKGIDVSAHLGALENGFNTIAVIGTNLNQYYPSENKDVQIEIENKGLVVSQFSPANQTQRWFFPLRNGVMSGLSLATIIMEAGETSGALKQADFALKQNRKILIAKNVMENKKIKWPEKYVEKGAVVVESPRDVLRELATVEVLNIKSKKDSDYQYKIRQVDVDLSTVKDPEKCID
ncbi:DNA-processing protein DprA [Fundicoccus culcitae]|uniref:DNA-protecting protein DprA n=1 Tax=Fundicoccus culcitae TaxID=2969821 RepID=A0ABY5P8N5_9LACT|nr:DNA-processing protein DprA [Fundicoccus culcitae]UUX35126.1 DNA-protecting protein DprA [Fundicoccus culcitae]